MSKLDKSDRTSPSFPNENFHIIFSYKEIVNSYKERFHSLNNPSPYRDFNIRLFALSIAMLSSEAR